MPPRILSFLSLIFVIPPLAGAATVVLQQGNLLSGTYAGTTDAFVTNGTTNNASPTRNYGGAGALAISASTAAAPANTQGEFQSFIEFDLALAKSSFDSQFGVGAWTVTAVQLQLTAAAPNNAIFNGFSLTNPLNTAGNIDVRWMANDSWVEGTGTPSNSQTSGMTYNNFSTFTGGSDQALGTFAFGGGITGVTNFNLGLTSGLLGDIASGSASTFQMMASSGSQVSALFDSKNFGSSASARPALSITAVAAAPEPGRAALLVSALGVMMLRRRRMA